MWAVWVMMVVVVGVGCVGRVTTDEDTLRRVTRRGQSSFGITNLDIRDAILILHKSIKDLDNKLYRHEAREVQAADLSNRTLAGLAQSQNQVKNNMQGMPRQLTGMEERILSMEALIQTTDERQRMMLRRITEALDRLVTSSQDPISSPTLPGLPPHPNPPGNQQEGVMLNQVKKLIRKLNVVDNFLQENMLRVTNEVHVVGESLEGHMSHLQERNERLSAQVANGGDATLSALRDLSSTLDTAATDIRTEVQSIEVVGGGRGGCENGAGGEVMARLDSLDHLYREQEQELHDLTEQTHKSLEDHLVTLQTLLFESHTGQAIINASVDHLTHSLGLLNSTTQDGMNRFSSQLREVVESKAEHVEATISHLGDELKEGNVNIMDNLDDRASQTENLQNTVLENYSELSVEISSLKRVEQVMMNTADAVLDTKRSIEFGIQQIILELGEIVKNSGSRINSTLSDQISNISFAILKNQTSALTNMTAKMEQEISQVWRQIGIMYQQMSQSVDLLDQLKDTTKEHMNASLSRVGDMDGTVGKINTKVADVEDNLNYLLGRLSLVVSEFNLMKSGVGDELMRLRENLVQENSENSGVVQIDNGVDFAGEIQPPSDSRYNVNRKRHVPPHSGPYPNYKPQPLSVF